MENSENELVSILENIHRAFDTKNFTKASTLLDAVLACFVENVSESEIDRRLENIFSEDNGLVKILTFTSFRPTENAKLNITIFKLYDEIVQRHAHKLPPYAQWISEVCQQCILSLHTTENERLNATTVIQTLVRGNLCEYVDLDELITRILLLLNNWNTKVKLVEKLLELVGLVVLHNGDRIYNLQNEIQEIFLKKLEQFAYFSVRIGALNGLKYFLSKCGQSLNGGDKQRIYGCIKRLTEPPDGDDWRNVNRCALGVLESVIHTFGDLILADYRDWHNMIMTKWMPLSWANQKVAFAFLKSFYTFISHRLSSDAPHIAGEEAPNLHHDILTFLTEHFKTALQLPNLPPYFIRVTIQGIGMMAEPCREHLPLENLTQLMMLIMSRMQSITKSLQSGCTDSLEFFSDYSKTLSRIMLHANGFSAAALDVLCAVIVALIRNFHSIFGAHHQSTINALMDTFRNLMRLGDTFLDDVLKRIIREGVIWTIDSNNADDCAENVPTYKSYLPFWQGLLSGWSVIIEHKIYDHMMNTLFHIIDKLDLSTRKRIHRDNAGNDLELHFCDPNYDLEPNRPRDFHLFFNLVDFYRDILCQESFFKWLKRFVETMIRKSIEYPLVSGYLKLMQTALEYIGEAKYFDSKENAGNESYAHIMHFLRGVILKANQTSGELQIACLNLLFSSPTIMLKDLIIDLIPAFVIAFNIGQSNVNIWIASKALSAMERCFGTQELTSEKAELFLHDVLPSLEPYLRGVTCVSTNNTSALEKQPADGVIGSDLSKFQRRIILFLGNLEPDRCLNLLRRDDKKSDLVRWNDFGKIVCIDLNGPNSRLRICLDALLPRISELACTSTERQTKMAACEFLHAILLYVLGTNKHSGKLWKELCSRMLVLGCDADEAVRQMFSPLITQTMHYMSRKEQINHDGVDILLQCLMEALSHRTNSAVRQLAAQSLREYLEWAIKQTTQQHMLAAPISVTTLIEKIKLFSLDSAHEKRLGAALAFNNLYRILREEYYNVSGFWLELFYVFCMNFRLCEEFGDGNVHSEPDLEQVSASLDHLIRVFCERKHIFNASSSQQHAPVAAFGGHQLRDAVKWLFRQCGAARPNFRHKAMEMFTKLAVCVDAHDSASSFLLETETIESIIEVCVGNRLNGKGIAARPDLCHIDRRNERISRIREWLETVYAALDCYNWLINDQLVPNVADLFNQSEAVSRVITYFVNNVFRSNVDELLILVEEHRMLIDGEDDDLGIEEIGPDSANRNDELERITLNKCMILLRIYELMTKMLIPHYFPSNTRFFKIVIDGLFEPQSIGFESKDITTRAKLSKCTEILIETIHDVASAESKQKFDKLLGKAVIEQYKRCLNVTQPILRLDGIENVQFDRLGGIEMVCRLHAKNSINLDQETRDYLSSTASEMLYKLFDGVRETDGDVCYAVTPKPDAQHLANQLMRISLLKQSICCELVDLLLNATDLQVRDCGVTIKHGKHFLNIYKSAILPYLVNGADIVFVVERLVQGITVKSFQYILFILIEVAEFVYKRYANDKIKMEMLTDAVLAQWPNLLEKLSVENDAKTAIIHQLMLLMANIARICPYELAEMGQRANGFENWLISIMTDGETQPDIKSQAIFLLPCIIGSEHTEHETVKRALDQFKDSNPMYSSELGEGTLKRAAFEMVFQSILDALVASRSPILLKFLIESTAADIEHIMKDDIALHVKSLMHNLSDNCEHMQCVLNVPYSFIASERCPSIGRISILRRFQVPMIRESPIESVVRFFADHITDIQGWCIADYQRKNSSFKVEQALTARICAFGLMEIMFEILPKETLLDKSCDISIALLGADKIDSGEELIRTMAQLAFNAHSDRFCTDDSTIVELYRRYQCAAYRALCAFTCNTQTALERYEKFLFQENPDEHRCIWKHLIDTTNDQLYTDLTLEVDRYPESRERFVSIRRIRNERPPNKYIKSQSVFDSSLSQEVTKIDLNLSSVRTASGAKQFRNRTATHRLEKNSINDHEVMATLCAVVEHMFESGITLIYDTIRASKAPKWIEWICATLEDDTVHLNIRLFLATLIDNCRHRFRSFANTITKAILKLLTSHAFSRNMNAFYVIMAVNLLEWNQAYTIVTPDEIRMANEFIAIWIQNASHEHAAVVSRNLKVITCLVEIWRSHIRPPYDFLRDSIDDSIVNVRYGLRLSGILLANEVIPWSETTQTPYLLSLCLCLHHENTGVHRPASQVLGMALKQIILTQKAELNDEEFLAKLYSQLNALHNRNEDRFADVLHGIHLHYPAIVRRYLPKIVSIISRRNSVINGICLDMFLAGVTMYEENIYRELTEINIKTLLQSNDSRLLAKALHIVNKSLPKMNASEIKHIMTDIYACANSKDKDCRDVVYEIMIFVRKTCSETGMNRMAPKVLLKGLNDNDANLRGQIFTYWSQQDQLPLQFHERLERLFRDMYDPMTKQYFVSYCSQLLLQPAIDHGESKSPILPHLHDAGAKHVEYTIDTSWRSQNSSMRAPLFMESQRREIIDGKISQMSLRATLDKSSLVFEPTIDPSLMLQHSASITLQTQNAFMFSDEPQRLDRRSKHISTRAPEKATSQFHNLRKRILRDKQAISRTIALKTIERKMNSEKLQEEQRKSAVGKVILTRRYRDGDYPDFHVNNLALLLPLQTLVKQDMLVARQLLITINQTICTTLDENAKHQFLLSVGESISNIFGHTEQRDPILFGALIEIALNSPQTINIEPDHLISVSTVNNMTAMGILLLENRLKCNGNGVPTTASDEKMKIWLKLARMYQDLSEFDIFAEIYADKLQNTDPRLLRAIEFESMSDYGNAFDLYAKIIEDSQLTENDIADQLSFRCLEKMGDWSGLCSTASDQIDVVDDLWMDNWNKKNLLPHHMRAEMRILLDGTATDRTFVENVERWLRDPDRANYIQTNFADILMMLFIANQDYSAALGYSEKVFRRFLKDWNNISVQSTKIQIEKVLEISIIAELHEYCKILLNANGEREFIKRWENTRMYATDSLRIWESLVAFRKFISKKPLRNPDSHSDLLTIRLTKSVFDMQLKLTDIALRQNNVALAKRTMKQLQRCVQNDSNDVRSAHWNVLKAKCLLLESQQATMDTRQSLKLLVHAYQQNFTTMTEQNALLDVNPKIHINVMEQFAEINESLLDRIGKCGTIDDNVQQQIIDLTQWSSKETFFGRINDIICLNFQKFMELAKKYEDVLQSSSLDFAVTVNGIGETYNRFAMLYQQYHDVENTVALSLNDERNILVAVLRGMKFGSKNACLQFPRVLQLSTLADMQLIKEFHEETFPVPGWLFIKWIPQIMARFTFESPSFLDKLMVRLAKSYPSALRFPFNLAYSEYAEKQLGTAREVVGQIRDLIQNSMVEKFIGSIKCLNLPDKLLRTHLERIFQNIKNNDQYTNEEFHNHLTHLTRTVFENELRGSIVERVRPFKATLDKLLTLKLDINRSEIDNLFKKSLDKLSKLPLIDSVKLEKIAPWLQEYQWYMSDECIELPGQYTGESRPNLEGNMKIVRFGSIVKVFSTNQRPIKLSILCSDGNTYNFLTKYGEDLRQDQCIQQMQRLITDQLATDKTCRAHNLSVETFNVIPISPFCGLLSWVENTQSVEQLLANNNDKQIIHQYHEFLEKASIGQPKSHEDRYGGAVTVYSSQEIAENFASIGTSVPQDILRNALYEMSASPECFFMLRNNFASSLASMGIGNWILGIGDRHLSNLLINKSTGKVVGIDFGLSYGMATRNSSVPELIPLRLTPQMVKAMSPMNTSGLIKKSMIFTLRSIRDERKTIMTAMAAVMTDHATINLSLSTPNDIESGINTDNWDSKRHIRVVNKKLMGANPIHLIANDLQCGRISRNKRYMDGYLSLLMNNSCSKMAENDLSTDEQVKCLINLATDPSILGITYYGLSPWI